MEYKPDWDIVKHHHTDWWHQKGMVLFVIAKRKEPLFDAPRPPLPEDPVERWLDIDHRIKHSEHLIARRHYLGDAFPSMVHYLGPGCVALYVGCSGDFSRCTGDFGQNGNNDTIWFYPFMDDITTGPPIRFDPENYYWKRHLAMIEVGVHRAEGRYHVGLPDMVENIDILASARGTQALLFDLIENGEHVHRYQRQIIDAWFQYYDILFELVKDSDGGCSFQTYNLWAPGRMVKTQCDLGALISPKMFREFVLPYTIEQCERLDYSIFHWDGPDCICHLDALLEIEALNAIQWTPGAGNEPCDHPRWYPLYEKILKAGKSLQLHSSSPDGAHRLIQTFGQEGLWLGLNFETEEEGLEFLAKYDR
ncbi:MAG: hypothetical protein PVG32_11680 [Anaerolineales bacterium]|jgi:hypothetical protein